MEIIAVEWSFESEQFVQHATERPDIRFGPVRFASTELRRDVIRGATHRLGQITLRV